jgi:cyclopropane fatty-acyl-phospholipid synthase-like methyltransferase
MNKSNKKWVNKPRKEIINNIDHFKKGSVLDLGGSDGVNDIYLAEEGFSVTNVDNDKEAVENFLKEAKQNGLEVKGVITNLNKFEISEVYDNIISFFTLHFLTYDNALELLKSAVKNTSSGGTHLLRGFTNVGDFNKNPITKNKFYPDKKFLPTFYKDRGFEIIKYDTQLGPTRSGDKQEKYMLLAKNTS